MDCMHNGSVALIIVLLLLSAGALFGFYVAFDKIGTLDTRLDTLEFSPLASSAAETTTPETSSTEPFSIADSSGSVSIPSAILFETQSSPQLKPQSMLVVTVETVQKKSDGTIAIGLKVFTNEAASYTAFDPRSFFEIIDLEGRTNRVVDVVGQFSSMPPKSAVSGVVLFQESPERQTVILQITAGDTLKHYEFDFSQRTYKEIVLG